MTIVFYSTNAQQYDGATREIRTFPPRMAVWDAVARAYPEDDFVVVTQPPAFFVADVVGTSLAPSPAHVRFIASEKQTAREHADEICALKPDVAIAASFWVAPFDWLCVEDALVAELLRERGVRVLAHPTETALSCYDKFRTQILLEKHGFPVPKALHISYQQLWAERSHREVRTNVYKEYTLSRLAALSYPVVIKDTVGLSSYGMEVATTYKQALYYLFSGRTHGDRIVQEYLSGEQFGTEIYASQGTYRVLPPLRFSLNRYGITSPKQSVKLGPVSAERYHLDELNALLVRLAQVLRLDGIAQVDLVFDGAHWHIIEVNPRLSGMSETYAAALQTPLCVLLRDLARGMLPSVARMQCVCNIKVPLLSDAMLERLAQDSAIAYVHQIHHTAAKQEREKGYCEVIVRAPTVPAVIAELERIAATYPGATEAAFVEQAKALAAEIAG